MDYQEIFNEAQEAARKACQEFADKHWSGKDGGACGFSWVKFYDARDPFVKWLKSKIKEAGFKHSGGNLLNLDGSFPRGGARQEVRQYGHPGYPKGWDIWNPGEWPGQSIDTKVAGSWAFVQVLEKHGINAFVGERLD